ncbi:hypothetical protein [Paraburkholderia caballeronis]|uniref:hypothetical protein n=1 Tax=Paraburkholderia caballeronis TaxID=416943 RepID=UPI001066CC45|nr:hypothetical protein [Paraburkholderia caballeronis]TDV04650.1 hypothetical protein C7408_13112 [Paraburkholderia caballeronis]TDV07893.1 hypothetical protein C7406_13312 [Paraburkholderia caballeronis]TDV18184.1 hypothetical protein C7404_13112 [Paraburkholderia caballeronis]
MSELKLFKVKAKINSVNGRDELHGDEHVLACDIGLEFNQSNRFLDKLDGALVETFYWRNPSSDDVRQENVEGVERFTDFPNLRPVMESLAFPMKWLGKYEEALFILHHGEDDDRDIRLGDVKVNEIKFTPKEGGTVLVSARIQGHPHEGDLARLFTVLQREATVTVDTDPDDDEAGELPPEDSPKPAKRQRKGKQADAFDAERVQDIKDAMTSAGASH